MKSAFSLDGVRVEHRALPRRDFCVELPQPPEILFASLPGRGRFATPDFGGRVVQQKREG